MNKRHMSDVPLSDMEESSKCFWVVILAGILIFVIGYLGDKFGL